MRVLIQSSRPDQLIQDAGCVTIYLDDLTISVSDGCLEVQNEDGCPAFWMDLPQMHSIIEGRAQLTIGRTDSSQCSLRWEKLK